MHSLAAHAVPGCSFLAANFNLSARPELHHANRFLRPRGPDATTVRSLGNDWSFLHNLLSMTGAVTTQPFISADGRRAAVFNGEIYNFRALARQLAGSADAYASDGFALLPAYERWGVSFVQHLEGEFALVVVDLDRRRAVVSADVFGTKPLWFAIWQPPQAPAPPRILVATYESALLALGAPRASIKAAPPNEALVLRFGEPQPRKGVPLVRWDLRQHKNHTNDWAAAFREAVRVRTRGVKHRIFIGLSSGYDSGAILGALALERTPFLAYAIKAQEDVGVLAARARYCEGVGEVALLQLSGSRFAREERWLAQRCEKYAYEMEARKGELACSDEGAVGVSVVLGRVRRRGGLIYLSGSGSDEIISDYARDGRKVYPHSCFGGRWPADLAPIFPWCSFYGGSQRAFLMKEELVSGAHGIEGRYPFLDPKVVQEFLWLKPELKNAEYKKPVADFLRAHRVPTAWGRKIGFTAGRDTDATALAAGAAREPLLHGEVLT